MQTLTITELNKKAGMGKNGKPYVMVKIKASEFGDKILTGFAKPDGSFPYSVGQSFSAVVEENGTYTNFTIPKTTEFPSFPNAKAVPTASPNGQAQSKAIEMMERTNELLAKILGALNARIGIVSSETEELTPDNEEALPF